MSRTVRFKLTEEEYQVVLASSKGLGISVDVLAKQALAWTLQQARQLSAAAQADQVTQVLPQPGETDHV